MEPKKIYLYGIFGVYNYGCEAIVRSVSMQLKNIYPSANIVYKSHRYKEDSEMLSDCKSVKVEALEPRLSERQKKSIFCKGIRFIKRKLKLIKEEEKFLAKMDWISDCDLLVIIGGDVLDIGANVNSKYDNGNIRASKLAKKYGAKVLLWGISIAYDDFERNIEAKSILLDYFNSYCDYGIIRDKKSYEYLRSNGISNISLCSDPAFALCDIGSKKEINSRNRVLGVNLSPLSNRYLHADQEKTKNVDVWVGIIEKIMKNVEFESVMLIPHVVNPDFKQDDDFGYLKEIYEGLLEKKINVSLAPGNLSFLKIREYLMKCDLILPARMHCAVNSLSCAVPTVLLAYSPKAFGMCEHVYGNNSLVVDMNALLCGNDFEKIYNAYNELDEIHEYLLTKVSDLKADALSAGKIVYEQIGEI